MVVELAALVLLLCYRDLAALAQGVLLFCCCGWRTPNPNIGALIIRIGFGGILYYNLTI